MHKKQIIFYGGLTILVGVFLTLSCATADLLQQDPSLIPLFLTQMLPVLHGTMLLGIGFGLPLIIVAAILGWGQVMLLMTGQISPHLEQEGLLKALRTLFNGW